MLSVRELKEADIPLIIEYWLGSKNLFLISMGVDLNKLPTREGMMQMLMEQLGTPVQKKKSYCMIWEHNSQPIGHCNTNPIKFGEYAFMHLHIWNINERKKGLGTQLVKMTLPYFFENLRLKKLYSEPYALNPAPNRTLERVGFELLKEYVTTPGSINFKQPVKRWELKYEKFKNIL
jgi:RimJ/RimL family protein N-acetyltransferase